MGMAHDTEQIAIFRVARVWKGEVGQRFEMRALETTTVCWGFSPELLKVGTELLVYATKHPILGYATSICYGHHRWVEGTSEVLDLGPGSAPSV